MKIKITRSVGIEGKFVQPGEVVDAPRPLALNLIERDRAVAVEDDTPAEVVTDDGPKFLDSTAAPDEPEQPAAKSKRGK
jgi:hypothetical protein